MALPASGALAASAINTELGRSSTAEISLATAAAGTYATINTASGSYPNNTTPHSMSEWYSYDHSAGAVPTIATADMFTSTIPDCGVNWTVGVSITYTNPNNTTYKVAVYDAAGSTLIADDIGFVSSWSAYDTGFNGDPGLFTHNRSAEFTVKVIRRSDSTVMDDLLATAVTQNMGDAC